MRVLALIAVCVLSACGARTECTGSGTVWVAALDDFGTVGVTAVAERKIVFVNETPRPVQVDALEVVDADGAPASDFTLSTSRVELVAGCAAPSRAFVLISFAPQRAGVREVFVRGKTSDASLPSFNVPFHALKRAPVASAPAVHNFGTIASLPAPYAATRTTLTVRNIGTPESRLRITGFEVSAQNAETGANELCVGAVERARCVGGLSGGELGAGEALEVPLAVIPARAGLKAWRVTVFTSDPFRPRLSIDVGALALAVPECELELSPRRLELTAGPEKIDAAFSVKNVGRDACVLRDFELSGTLARHLTHDAPRVLVLEAGLSARIHVAARGLEPVPGGVAALRFSVSRSLGPIETVQIDWVPASSCLVVTPTSLDFGVVAQTCSSPLRTVHLYNICAQPIRLADVRLASAGGVAAGSPACPGPTPCPEFRLVSAAGSVLEPGQTPARLTLQYRPIDYGADSGALAIVVDAPGGERSTHVVSLNAMGDARMRNQDSFVIERRGKLDLLFVIDDSPSFAPRQAAVQQNLRELLTRATANRPLDLQVGVTTTDDTATGAQGSLLASPQGVKIFTDAMPDLVDQVLAAAAVGASGSETETCLSAAAKALTGPKAADPAHNLGFSRAGATLTVVCITDAREQTSPLHPSVSSLSTLPGLTWSVVGPFSNACAVEALDDGVHAQLVQSFFGDRIDVCSTSPWFVNWRIPARPARTLFFLTARPLPSTLNVFVDGVLVPPSSWTYDAASNAVQLSPALLPIDGGNTVRVEYDDAAECF